MEEGADEGGREYGAGLDASRAGDAVERVKGSKVSWL
jgi:hypothetical protein